MGSINSQLSLSHEKAIASAHEKAITSADPWGARLTIDVERINSQLSLSHVKVITSVDLGG